MRGGSPDIGSAVPGPSTDALYISWYTTDSFFFFFVSVLFPPVAWFVLPVIKLV